jgi:beta-lactamase regulating signal transducer with metallopeptidase domain
MTGHSLLWIVLAAIALAAVRELILFQRWNSNLRRKRQEQMTLLRQYRYSALSQSKPRYGNLSQRV